MKGRQRSYLKGLAQQIDATVQIGKFGLSENVIGAIDEALSSRELVKVKILEGAELLPKETCAKVAEMLDAEFVQAIGHKFVLYRPAKDKDKRKIILPR